VQTDDKTHTVPLLSAERCDDRTIGESRGSFVFTSTHKCNMAFSLISASQTGLLYDTDVVLSTRYSYSVLL